MNKGKGHSRSQYNLAASTESTESTEAVVVNTKEVGERTIPKLNIIEHGFDLAQDINRDPIIFPANIVKYSIYIVPNEELTATAQNVTINTPIERTGSRIVGRSGYAFTIYDPRLGSSHYNKTCGNSSCGKTTECIGHPGVIKLTTKYYYPQFIGDIVKVLISVCNSCSKPLITQTQIEANNISSYVGKKRLHAVAKFVSSSTALPCPTVHRVSLNYTCKANTDFDTEATKKTLIVKRKVATKTSGSGNSSATSTMNSQEVWNILNAIDDEDAKLLGFENSHPRDMLFNKLTVIPPCARAGTHVKGVYENNPIDALYNDVLKKNRELQDILNTQMKQERISFNPDSVYKIKSGADGIEVVITQTVNETNKNHEYIWPDDIRNHINNINETINALKTIFDEDTNYVKVLVRDLIKYQNVIEKLQQTLLEFGLRPDYGLQLSNDKVYVQIVQYLTLVQNIIATEIDKFNISESRQSSQVSFIHDIQELIRRIMVDVDQKPTSRGGRNIKVIKSLLATLKGKRGLFRFYLLGKRVGSSARTVIVNEPNVRLGHTIIPAIFAPNLHIPEGVTNFNQHEIDNLWNAGRITHVKLRRKGNRFQLVTPAMIEHGIRPKIGDMIWRWGQDGDVAILNRQPTLHKQGFMGHVIKFAPVKNIGLNIAETQAYNADFDGDEMNIHMPQDPTSRLEVGMISTVINCIIAEQDSDPIVGPVFDAPGAMMMMTMPRIQKTSSGLTFLGPQIISPEKYQYYISGLHNNDSHIYLSERLELHGMSRYSGPSVFSRTLPYDFSYVKGDVRIQDGLLLSGKLTKSVVGPKRGGIVGVLAQDPKYGKERAAVFIDDITYLTQVWNIDYGMTMNAADCFPDDPEFKSAIKEVHLRTLEKSRIIMERQANSQSKIERENLNRDLTSAMDAKGQLSDVIDTYLSSEHAFRMASESGSKGTTHNLIASVTGGRVIRLGGKFYQGSDTERIPYHPLNASELYDPQYRGLVLNSLSSGSTRASEFYIAQAGREGMAHTALTTQDTGAMNRDTHHFTENFRVDNYGAVTDIQNDMVITLIYGNDGLNPKHLVPMNIKKVNRNSSEMLSPIDFYRLANRINSQYGFQDNLN